MDYGLGVRSYGLKNRLLITNQQLATQRGFTLLELLIAVAIIAILVAIALPRYLEATNRAKTATDKANIKMINTQIELYQLSTGYYPSAPWMPELLMSASYFPDGPPECPFLKGNTEYYHLTAPLGRHGNPGGYKLNICSGYHPPDANLYTCQPWNDRTPRLMRVIEQQHKDMYPDAHGPRWTE